MLCERGRPPASPRISEAVIILRRWEQDGMFIIFIIIAFIVHLFALWQTEWDGLRSNTGESTEAWLEVVLGSAGMDKREDEGLLVFCCSALLYGVKPCLMDTSATISPSYTQSTHGKRHAVILQTELDTMLAEITMSTGLPHSQHRTLLW